MKPQNSENRESAEPDRDPDLAGAEAAMRRAAARAHRRAADGDRSIAVFENGRIVWVKPNDEIFR
ncbi:MAG: hypothetical protein OXI87_00235 [Albidovulum sp.]|nr:hypothetical protein [Albidovulum sp.]MDE0303302.1 hypothetical protein [Albidovulum sp.]